jgi:hypothetical protein
MAVFSTALGSSHLEAGEIEFDMSGTCAKMRETVREIDMDKINNPGRIALRNLTREAVAFFKQL